MHYKGGFYYFNSEQLTGRRTEARRYPQHEGNCQVNITFSLTLVPYTAAVLASQRSTRLKA